MAQQMPRVQEDLEKTVQLFPTIIEGHHPCWRDVQVLLQQIFQAGDRDWILGKDRELANCDGNRQPWPRADLNWDYNNACETACHNMVMQ